MRSRHTQMLNPSGNAFVQFTHIKQLLSNLKSRNFLKPALFTRCPSLTGFPILSRSTRNKAQSMYALIIGISTKLVLRTTFLPPSSITLSTIAPEVKSSLWWMVSPDIIKSILFPRINTRQLLFVLGALSPIRNSLLVLRTLVQLFNALCLMPSMISSTLYNHILMTYSLIPCTESIIQSTSEPFSSIVGFTTYA
jgi:hypothetical protein